MGGVSVNVVKFLTLLCRLPEPFAVLSKCGKAIYAIAQLSHSYIELYLQHVGHITDLINESEI